jgi:hypothetical protein
MDVMKWNSEVLMNLFFLALSNARMSWVRALAS